MEKSQGIPGQFSCSNNPHIGVKFSMDCEAVVLLHSQQLIPFYQHRELVLTNYPKSSRKA